MNDWAKLLLPLLVGLTVTGGVGCQYYEDFRVKKATADYREEAAELLRAYRLCVQKYEAEPARAKEYCAAYHETLKQIEIRRQDLH